jgi:hypothetical protein
VYPHNLVLASTLRDLFFPRSHPVFDPFERLQVDRDGSPVWAVSHCPRRRVAGFFSW